MSFLDRFKFYKESSSIIRHTRRALLTKNGFVITSEVGDSEEFTKAHAALQGEIEALGQKHKKEINTYIAQNFLGYTRPPTTKEIKEKLDTNSLFKSGFLRLTDIHKQELGQLTGKLKSLVEKNEWDKQDARREQLKSLTSEQRRDLRNKASQERYKTEEGRAKRIYHNVNYYAQQGERIRQVQQQRYQNDPEFRAKQIERVKQRAQKPGMKELGAAEARERTRLNREGLNEDCPCGCEGVLKTHRKNFRAKFWEGFNKTSSWMGFKVASITVAGIDMNAYWAGEDWNDCILAAKKKPGGGRVTPKKVAPTPQQNIFPKTNPLEGLTSREDLIKSQPESFKGVRPDMSRDQFVQQMTRNRDDARGAVTCPECKGAGCDYCTNGKVNTIQQATKIIYDHIYKTHDLGNFNQPDIESLKELPDSFKKSDILMRVDNGIVFPKEDISPTHLMFADLLGKHEDLVPAVKCPDFESKYGQMLYHFSGKDGIKITSKMDKEVDALWDHLEKHHGIKFSWPVNGNAIANRGFESLESQASENRKLQTSLNSAIKQLGRDAVRNSVVQGIRDDLVSKPALSSAGTNLHHFLHMHFESTGRYASKELILQHMITQDLMSLHKSMSHRAILDQGLTVSTPNKEHLTNPTHNWES